MDGITLGHHVVPNTTAKYPSPPQEIDTVLNTHRRMLSALLMVVGGQCWMESAPATTLSIKKLNASTVNVVNLASSFKSA
jgi:hypothetical protein